ncbi:MAG: ankyrin repeat domain-containing protein [Gammaproteobacteria bacterium]
MTADRPLPINQSWLLEKLKVLVGEELYNKEGTCHGFEHVLGQAAINRNLSAATKRLNWLHYGPPQPDGSEEAPTPEQREELIRVIGTLTSDPKFGKMLDKKDIIVPDDKFENVFKGRESVALDWIFNGTPAGHDEVISAEELKSLIQIAQGIRAYYAKQFREQSLDVEQALAEFDKKYPRFLYLINLQIFSENMVLYQSPEKEQFARFFEPGAKPAQNTVSTHVIPLIAPTELDIKKEGITTTRIEQLAVISGIYTLDKCKTYYQTLFKHIKNNLAELRTECEAKGKKLVELPFFISNVVVNNHATSILFNAESEQFIFVDANNPPPYEVGIDMIDQNTMNSFNSVQFNSYDMYMGSTIYIDSESTVMRNIIHNWQSDPQLRVLLEKENPIDIMINKMLQLAKEESVSEEVKVAISEIVKHARLHNEILLTSGNKQVFELLLKSGFDPDFLANKFGNTALLTAINNNQEDVVKLLLDSGINPNAINLINKESPLMAAIHHGNKTIIAMLLAHGANPNQVMKRGPNEYLPLHEAILQSKTHSESKEIVTLLLNAGANPEERSTLPDETELTAYEIAARHGSPDVNAIMEAEARLLIDKLASLKTKLQDLPSNNTHIEELKNASVHISSYHQLNNMIVSALFDAIISNDQDRVKLLLSTGVNPNQTNELGETLLLTAVINGNRSMVETILATPGINVNQANKSGVTPLMAATQKDAGIVQLLVDAGANVNVTNGPITPLTLAMDNNNLDAMRILIKAGATINLSREGNPLLKAVKDDKLDAVKLLLAEGADPNLLILDHDPQKHSMTVLTFAMSWKKPSQIYDAIKQHQNNLDRLKNAVLSQHNSDPGFTSIVNTIKNATNYYSLLTHILEYLKNSDITQSTRDLLQESLRFEFTLAITEGNTALVRELLNIGMDPNLGNDYVSPLYLAAIGGNIEIADMLIKAGANVNFVSKIMLTPLIRASENGHHDMVKLLLDADADMTCSAPIIRDDGSSPTLSAPEIAQLNNHTAVTQVFADNAIKIQNLIDKIRALNIVLDENHLKHLDLFSRASHYWNSYKEIIDLCKERFTQAVSENDADTMKKLLSIEDERVVKALKSIAPLPSLTRVHATLYSRHKAPVHKGTEPSPLAEVDNTPRKDFKS